jgi:hypothetical protein
LIRTYVDELQTGGAAAGLAILDLSGAKGGGAAAPASFFYGNWIGQGQKDGVETNSFAAWGIRTPAGKPTAFRVRRLNHSAKAAYLSARFKLSSVVINNPYTFAAAAASPLQLIG